jgi:hypothetical protein
MNWKSDAVISGMHRKGNSGGKIGQDGFRDDDAVLSVTGFGYCLYGSLFGIVLGPCWR